MLKTSINPANLQEHLESASNAGQKGQAQYLTPAVWAAALARALPPYRPCLTDFSCGHGTLLAGAAAPSTDHLLGCDIEAVTLAPESRLAPRFVNADITRFFPLLHACQWRADLVVLNPPWDLHQYRDRVAMLAESDCYNVRAAFAAHDGRTSKDTIDSTVLALLMALDRLTVYGEGFLAGNQATLERLILRPDAPHAALRRRVWANVIIPGNICAPDWETNHGSTTVQPPFNQMATTVQPNGNEPDGFATGILYFARDHRGGFKDSLRIAPGTPLAVVAEQLGTPGFRFARTGARLRPGYANLESPGLWLAAQEEWEALQGARTRSQWNIYLDADGTLRTNLSRFDSASGRADKAEADRLFALNGKHPMHLVMARATRRDLERAVHGSQWRVAPAVSAAVEGAIADYNRARAPLYPLNQIQRLGYLDENDTIRCVKDLGGFVAGQSYPLETQTIRTRRRGTKMNLEGSLDEVEYDGSELALYLVVAKDTRKLFMDARLMDSSVTLSIQEPDAPSPIDYTLQQLVEHFEIPEVPDVAACNPEGYAANLALLREIEQLVAN